MENENNTKQENNADISEDALEQSKPQTVVRPKMNLAPNSKHEVSGTETIDNDVDNKNSEENITPEEIAAGAQNQVEAPEKEKTEKQSPETDQNTTEEAPPVMPAPQQSSGSFNSPPPPKKTKTGMSDNMKYLLIGLLIVLLVAGGIVAWNILTAEDESSTDSNSQVTQEPVDTTEPADTTAPEATLTVPADGDTVSGTFMIEGALDDESAIDNVILYMNDAMAEEVNNPSDTFSFEVDSLNFANGSYTLYITAVDSEGNVGESDTVTIEIANEPPESTEDNDEADDESVDEEPAGLPKTGAGWH